MKTAKAIVAALMAFLASVSSALTDGKLTTTEAVVALLALVGAYGATWTVPNAGTISRAVLDREVVRARYSHTHYGGKAGAPTDADPLPPAERPIVE